MTHAIPETSLKHHRAQRFAAELEAAMAARGVGSRPLAEAVGCGRGAVQQWRHGSVLPRLEMARALAAALRWPRLEHLGRELRAKACAVCRAPFVDDSGSDNRLYCTIECRNVAGLRVSGVDTRTRAHRAERRLAVVAEAVAAYCRACEPEGRCYAEACELRPASPLPLVEELDARRAVPNPPNGHRAPGQQSAALRAAWARYTPQQRAERARRAAEARHGERVAS